MVVISADIGAHDNVHDATQKKTLNIILNFSPFFFLVYEKKSMLKKMDLNF
jgi:hypothetical protein